MSIVTGRLFDLIEQYPGIRELRSGPGSPIDCIYQQQVGFYVSGFDYPAAVYLSDGVPVGVCFADPADEDWKRATTWLYQTYVLRAHRRRGIATQLYYSLLEYVGHRAPQRWSGGNEHWHPHR